MDTFTKFDQLGACLAKLSFEAVSISLIRRIPEETDMWVVYLHYGGVAFSGIGDTPTDALSKALASTSQSQLKAVEAKAAELLS